MHEQSHVKYTLRFKSRASPGLSTEITSQSPQVGFPVQPFYLSFKVATLPPLLFFFFWLYCNMGVCVDCSKWKLIFACLGLGIYWRRNGLRWRAKGPVVIWFSMALETVRPSRAGHDSVTTGRHCFQGDTCHSWGSLWQHVMIRLAISNLCLIQCFLTCFSWLALSLLHCWSEALSLNSNCFGFFPTFIVIDLGKITWC